MSYQTRTRWCRDCEKFSVHWRDLPDLPRRWSSAIGVLPGLAWAKLVTPWNCRGCYGVPRGPLIRESRSRYD